MRIVLLMRHFQKQEKLRLEIEDLKKQSKVFRNRFKMLIEAQLEMINSEDWDQLMEYDIDATELKSIVKKNYILAKNT